MIEVGVAIAWLDLRYIVITMLYSRAMLTELTSQLNSASVRLN